MMGFKDGRDGFLKAGKNGFRMTQRWERWVSDHGLLEKIYESIYFFYISEKTLTIEKISWQDNLAQTHLSHFSNPFFLSFRKTHHSRQKIGSGKMGRSKKTHLTRTHLTPLVETVWAGGVWATSRGFCWHLVLPNLPSWQIRHLPAVAHPRLLGK